MAANGEESGNTVDGASEEVMMLMMVVSPVRVAVSTVKANRETLERLGLAGSI